jgi:RNA 2',3'-cyclic 3'-phosphodiesterase
VRLFVAVDIDDDTRAQLGRAREAFQSVLSSARVPPRVTWVNEESAHVTLRFIGETREETADAIRERLGQHFPARPFEVAWDRVGTFPSGSKPRVVWIGGAADDGLSSLAGMVNARLEPLLGPGESRPFKAHITLGRIKEPGKGADWPRALAAVRWAPTITRIDHVTLYASRTSPKGAVYTPLVTTRLN